MNLERILMAAEFAANAHKDQKRKYTGDPYIVHPISVARLVAGTPGATEEMVIAALLHDTVEDCGITFDEVRTMFGQRVMELVSEVTEISKRDDGNRAERKELDRRHFSAASSQGQTIKLADSLDNGRTILLHDRGFSKTYMAEKQALLRSMTQGDSTLYHDVRRMVDEFMKGAEIRESSTC